MYGFNYAPTDTGVFFIGHPDEPSVAFLRFARLAARTPAYGMSIAPDGRSLLFAQFMDHSADLMLVENFR